MSVYEIIGSDLMLPRGAIDKLEEKMFEIAKQPTGCLTQVGYIVPDIQKAMMTFVEDHGVGPWFLSGPFVPKGATYRGNPTDLELSLAIAYSGGIQVELIQQHDDQPSVYREKFAKDEQGFHHWAQGTLDIDADVARLEAKGYEVCFTAPSPRGTRVIYMDTSTTLPGMIELIEVTDAAFAQYQKAYDASVNWDGSNPIRSSAELVG